MLSVGKGYSVSYLTDSVGAGRENYYTGAVAEGEPPGRWLGRGARLLGLEGVVEAPLMSAVFDDLLNPADPRFADPETRSQASRLGSAPKQYRTPAQVVESRVEAYRVQHASAPTPEQVQAWTIC